MSELKDFYEVKWKNTEHPEIPVKNWFGIVRTYDFGELPLPKGRGFLLH